MKNSKKYLSLILSFCLFFVLATGNVSAISNTSNLGSDNITVIENNDNLVTVFGEKDGLEAYVTYDKISQEITAKTIENPRNITGFSLARPVESEYSIDVKTALDGDLTAIATNIETNEVLTINDSNVDSNTVQAQAVAPLIPVAQWLGALILAALATAAVIVINGVDYVDLADSKVETNVKKDPSGYYYAHVDYASNNVFIGPKMNYNAALNWLKASTDNNIFTPTRSRALTLARNVTMRDPIEHTNEFFTKGEGYYKHFHPYNPMFAGNKMPNHVWYFN